ILNHGFPRVRDTLERDIWLCWAMHLQHAFDRPRLSGAPGQDACAYARGVERHLGIEVILAPSLLNAIVLMLLCLRASMSLSPSSSLMGPEISSRSPSRVIVMPGFASLPR